MPNSPCSFYTSAPIRSLFARELDAVGQIVSTVYGNYGLMLRADAQAAAALPPHLLGRMVELSIDDGRLRGEIDCDAELLPFASESFKLVIAQHVLERMPRADAFADELARVLAPEGIALVFGFNPAGSWRPWLALHTRGGPLLRLRSAHFWQQQLARAQVDTLQIRFPGTLLPRAAKAGAAARRGSEWLARFGSSWLLLARKRRSVLTPLRLRSGARELALNPRLAPGAQRACA